MAATKKKTITKEQHLQLVGLLALAETHIKALEDIHESARAITGEEDDFGHTNDAVYGSHDIKGLLKNLGILVLK